VPKYLLRCRYTADGCRGGSARSWRDAQIRTTVLFTPEKVNYRPPGR
jgi:hypothetical protein